MFRKFAAIILLSLAGFGCTSETSIESMTCQELIERGVEVLYAPASVPSAVTAAEMETIDAQMKKIGCYN